MVGVFPLTKRPPLQPGEVAGFSGMFSLLSADLLSVCLVMAVGGFHRFGLPWWMYIGPIAFNCA